MRPNPAMPYRSVLRFLGLGILLVLIFGLLGFLLVRYASAKAKEAFLQANGQYSDLRIDVFNRSVEVKNLAWQSDSSAHPHRIQLTRLQLQGINLYQLLVKHTLQAKELRLDTGQIFINRLKKESMGDLGEAFYVTIGQVALRHIQLTVAYDSLVEWQALMQVRFGELHINTEDSLSITLKTGFRAVEGKIRNVQYQAPKGMYSFRMACIEINSGSQTLGIDSMTLLPESGKYEFAREKGNQSNRLELTVTRLDVEGLLYPQLFSRQVIIKSLWVQEAELYAFRDNRVPFIRNKIIPMPMQSLAKLAFALTIDSIRVENSTITVEEFAANGKAPGYIVFADLAAQMSRISNRYKPEMPSYAQLDATAKLSKEGTIAASFYLPLDSSRLYWVKGEVAHLPLTEINSLLENVGHVRAESGYLNRLSFDFSYNNFTSTGSIELDYQHLRLTSLHADKAKSTNYFKTLLMGVAISLNKNNNRSEEFRRGTISAERDPNRFVANFWWASLQSGLRSALVGN